MPDPPHNAAISTGPLEYTYDTLEFDIDATLDAPDGYEAANWLHLIRPLRGAERPAGIVGDLGSPEVPVPLRAHPPVPLLLEQTAAPTHTSAQPPTLAEAAQWTFGLTYSHEQASQDEILLAVTFNVRAGRSTRLAAELDLAAALARYATLGDRLRALMTAYIEPADARQDVRDAVAGTLATLVGDVAAAWADHWGEEASIAAAGKQTDVPDGDTHHFLVAVSYEHPHGGGTTLTAVTLSLDEQETSPGPNGWPTAQLRSAAGTFMALTRTPVSDRVCRYTPASPILVTGWPVVRLEWPGLNVASVGNGRGSLSARRNAHLVEGVPTNGEFVLSSATIMAPDTAMPLLQWSSELALTGATLGAALSAALSDLFAGATGPPVTLALAYGHRLVPPARGVPGSGLTSYLPAALYPAQPLSPAIAAALGEAAGRWQTANRPATEGGEWVVLLTLSSWLDPATSRPLLVLDRLALPLGGS